MEDNIKPKRQRNAMQPLVNSSDESDKEGSLSENSDLSEDEWTSSKKSRKSEKRVPKQTFKLKLAEKTKHLRKINKQNSSLEANNTKNIVSEIINADQNVASPINENVASQVTDVIQNATPETTDTSKHNLVTTTVDKCKTNSERLVKVESTYSPAKPKFETNEANAEIEILQKNVKPKVKCDIDLTTSEAKVEKEVIIKLEEKKESNQNRFKQEEKKEVQKSKEPIVLMYSVPSTPPVNLNFTIQSPQNVSTSIPQMNQYMMSNPNQNQPMPAAMYPQNPVYRQNYIQNSTLTGSGTVSNIPYSSPKVNPSPNFSPRNLANSQRSPSIRQVTPRHRTPINFTSPSRYRSPISQRTPSSSPQTPRTGSPVVRPRKIFSPTSKSPNTPKRNNITMTTVKASPIRSTINSSSKSTVFNKINNISPNGTVIHTGTGSVTITPRKVTPERPPVQRKLFKNEIEGTISCRSEYGTFIYVVNLANGTHIPLSSIQVQKLREQNHGVLPTKLKIPVPSDVADKIEPSFLIED